MDARKLLSDKWNTHQSYKDFFRREACLVTIDNNGGGYNELINNKKRLIIKPLDGSFGYGLVIPHHGTIVVGMKGIGNYAVLHTSTCITAKKRKIGDGLYLSTGAKITTDGDLGNGVTVAANSVVTKEFPTGYALLAGVPARKKVDRAIWYDQENGKHRERVIAIEKLKKSYLKN